jgi:hypothetical protein
VEVLEALQHCLQGQLQRPGADDAVEVLGMLRA